MKSLFGCALSIKSSIDIWRMNVESHKNVYIFIQGFDIWIALSYNTAVEVTWVTFSNHIKLQIHHKFAKSISFGNFGNSEIDSIKQKIRKETSSTYSLN